MLYGKYHFICRLENDAILPGYKGSTFRSVFGHALKRVVCVLKRVECEACGLRNRCVYARVFENPYRRGHARRRPHIGAAAPLCD